MYRLRAFYQQLLLVLCALLATWDGAWGQYRIPLRPRAELQSLRSLPLDGARSAASVQEASHPWTLTPPSPGELRSLSPDDPQLRAYTFALERPQTSPTESLGTYAQDRQGRYSWRATIYAPRAKNIGLRLSHYALPEGGALFIQRAGGELSGALTAAHNRPDSLLQIAPISTDRLEVYYEFPEGTPATALTLPFRIDAGFYGFRDLYSLRAEENFAQQGEPYFDHPSASLEDLSCAPNVMAYPERWKEARSTLLLIVGGTSASSGALINNTRQDGTPYVLTSAHCLNNLFRLLGNLPAVRQNAATTVFFFGFQSPLANGNVRATEEQSLSGATLVGYSEESEMCLLHIDGLPADASGRRSIPAAYQPYFAGWNRATSPEGPFFGIHHPGGSTKRYSLSADTRLELTDYSLTYRDEAGGMSEVSWMQKHWTINTWRVGVTAAGSSGSPLFDREGRIIGALTGGSSTCGSPYNDSYWALRAAWSPSSAGMGSLTYLSPWLDPAGTGSLTCDGYDPLAPNTVQRLSAIYADPALVGAPSRQPTQRFSPKTSIDGVGNRLRLPAIRGAKVLGAYLVFRGDGELLSRNLPQVQLTLERFAQRDGGAVPLMRLASTSLGQFARLDEAGRPEVGYRTFRTDTLEFFIPAPEGMELNLEEDTYLLSARTEDGRPWPLPLLAYSGRSADASSWSAWDHEQQGDWKRSADAPQGAYWIDLLVETPQVIPPLAPSGEALTPELYGYYHQGTLYLTGDPLFGQAYTLRVYDLTGQRHLVHTFPASPAGMASLRLSLPAGQYIAVIAPYGADAMKPSHRISLPFLHR